MLSSFLSVVAQLGATIFVLFCIINYFSLKPGGVGSMKVVSIGVLYFFSSAMILLVAAVLLLDISGYMRAGVTALFEAFVIHLCYGLLVSTLYLRSFMSRISSSIS